MTDYNDPFEQVGEIPTIDWNAAAAARADDAEPCTAEHDCYAVHPIVHRHGPLDSCALDCLDQAIGHVAERAPLDPACVLRCSCGWTPDFPDADWSTSDTQWERHTRMDF